MRWFCVLALVLLSGCRSDGGRAGADPFPLEDVVLENGLRVWMLPNPGSGLVASNVFVGAGATRESADTAGSSHFLEHLLFNGTTSRSQEQLYADVDHLGAYNNATTKREMTHYMMVAGRELLDDALELQADMLLRSTLPEAKFEKERGIVVEEISKDRDTPDYAVNLALDAMIFSRAPEYTRPVIGTPETIASLRREDVLAYYRRQYVPNNMLVVLMGDFEPARALSHLRRHFDAPAGDPTPAPPLSMSNASTLLRRRVAAPAHHLRLAIPMPEPGDDEFAATTLLTHLLVGSEGARVQSALRRDPAIQTTSVAGGLVHFQDNTLLQLDVDLAPGQPHQPALARILETIAAVTREGVTAQEWEHAITAKLGEAISQREQLHYFAIFAGDRLWQAPVAAERGFSRHIFRSWSQAPAVLRRLAQPSVTVAVVGPDLEDGVDPLDLASFGFAPEATVPDLPGSPAPPDAPTLARAAGAQAPSQTVLTNGLTLLHAASPTTRMFGIHVLVRDRSAREPSGRAGMADLLHRVVGRATEARDESAFQQQLDAMGASLKVTDSPWIPFDDYYTTPLYSFIRLECIDTFAADAIDLLAEMLQTPRLTEATIREARDQIDQARARAADQPAHRSRAALADRLYGDHPLARSVLGPAGSLDDVTPAELAAFAATYFAPDQLVISTVGNLDRDAVLDRIRARFAALASGPAGTAAVAVPLTTTSARVDLEVGGEQSYLRLARIVEVAPEDRWALPIAVQIASGRMQQDLREERGLAYSLGINCQFLESRAVLAASMGTRPENLEEAESGMLRYLTGGSITVDAHSIEAVVNRHLGRMRMRQVTRLGQAFRLGVDQVLSGGLDFAETEAAGMRRVTPADVARAATRYLGQGPLVTVVAR